MKSYIRRLIQIMGFDLVRSPQFQMLKQVSADAESLLDALANVPGLRGQCHSQLKQDLFVLLETGFKRGGYFVEFGATNGIDLSNTYLLEREFGWTGILAEPATAWHEALQRNRNAIIDTDCVSVAHRRYA